MRQRGREAKEVLVPEGDGTEPESEASGSLASLTFMICRLSR
jgi:hypothetical protein